MRLTLLLGLVILGSCTTVDPRIEPAPPTADFEAVQEAVFRHQFAESRSQMRNKLDVRFLRLETGDPPPAFLARFRDCAIPVAPESDAMLLEDGSPIDAVRHKRTGGTGCIFWVGQPQMQPDGHFVVEGDYYQGRRASSGHVYVVERVNGAWVVVDDTMTWISACPDVSDEMGRRGLRPGSTAGR